jgi:wyosine [tRNA(Phe)-imidazoG37] synthetase (radical SAM superfamily)
MSTILWHNIVFGPIISRRLGHSLGVNLLPIDGKICNFDCIYCECGWNKDGKKESHIPTKKEVFEALEGRISGLMKNGEKIDTITFSGNGEPTLHPNFPEIIDKTIELRNKYYPSAVISVLSNATQTDRKEIRDALLKVENPILKLDGADNDFVKKINNTPKGYTVEGIIDNLTHFKGNFILQTMFLRGTINGEKIDSTDPVLVKKWIDMVLKMRPKEVMVYTIDRETPTNSLEKVSVEEMEQIVKPLVASKIEVQIKG